MQIVPVRNSFQSSQLPALLHQFATWQMTGWLQIFSETATWFLYLEQGGLVYGSSSLDPLGRLDRHLRRLSLQIPSLVSAVRVQVRLLFEQAEKQTDDRSQTVPFVRDYRAICWLVEQRYLKPAQAGLLIEAMTRETLETLLSAPVNRYELQEANLDTFPKLHQLDLSTLLEQCQTSAQRQQALTHEISVAPDRASAVAPGDTGSIADVARHLTAKTSVIQSPPIAGTRTPLPGAGLSNKSVHTIVCIDDSPAILQTINSYLDDQSFSTVLINNPVRALMQIIRCNPSLILLDINMPGLDGYELCSLLRRNRSFRQTPIIMVTSNSGFIDRARAKMVGASGYLTKPFSQPDLVKTVFKYLS